MNATDVDLSVAIVTWRSDTQQLAATLRSLAVAVARLRHRGPATVRLQVFDNGAREAPLGELPLEPALHAQFDAIDCVPMPGNLGFGAAHNVALAHGLGNFHLVLNPDVELDPEALDRGTSYLREHPRASAVVPDGRAADGGPLYLAKAEPSVRVLLMRALAPRASARWFPQSLASYELHALAQRAEPTEVVLGSGCCMLLRARHFAEVGGFDPAFFLYFEDFDLSRRLARLGPLVYLPQMRIVHHGGGAARKGATHIAHFCRSALRYFSRWGWRF